MTEATCLHCLTRVVWVPTREGRVLGLDRFHDPEGTVTVFGGVATRHAPGMWIVDAFRYREHRCERSIQ